MWIDFNLLAYSLWLLHHFNVSLQKKISWSLLPKRYNGLEEILKKEVEELGGTNVKAGNRVVTLKAIRN